MSRLAVLIFFATCFSTGEQPPSSTGPVATPSPNVLVELFTSEGCSSCPPADALLSTLAERQDVVALSYHVDYWDYLGWRDPYSDAAHSARQRAYAQRLHARTYTPQMVVDGRAAFVGSRRREARRHLQDALAQPSPVTVEALTQHSGDALAVTFTTEGSPEGSLVHFALAERTATQDVRRGENKGRRLQHSNVVRTLRTTKRESGTMRLPLPEGLIPSAVRVAVWIQDGENGPVSGATWALTRTP